MKQYCVFLSVLCFTCKRIDTYVQVQKRYSRVAEEVHECLDSSWRLFRNVHHATWQTRMRIGVNIDLKWYGMVWYGKVWCCLWLWLWLWLCYFFSFIVLGVHEIYAANYPTWFDKITQFPKGLVKWNSQIKEQSWDGCFGKRISLHLSIFCFRFVNEYNVSLKSSGPLDEDRLQNSGVCWSP